MYLVELLAHCRKSAPTNFITKAPIFVIAGHKPTQVSPLTGFLRFPIADITRMTAGCEHSYGMSG
jgi:hypothetical protein